MCLAKKYCVLFKETAQDQWGSNCSWCSPTICIMIISLDKASSHISKSPSMYTLGLTAKMNSCLIYLLHALYVPVNSYHCGMTKAVDQDIKLYNSNKIVDSCLNCLSEVLRQFKPVLTNNVLSKIKNIKIFLLIFFLIFLQLHKNLCIAWASSRNAF